MQESIESLIKTRIKLRQTIGILLFPEKERSKETRGVEKIDSKESRSNFSSISLTSVSFMFKLLT